MTCIFSHWYENVPLNANISSLFPILHVFISAWGIPDWVVMLVGKIYWCKVLGKDIWQKLCTKLSCSKDISGIMATIMWSGWQNATTFNRNCDDEYSSINCYFTSFKISCWNLAKPLILRCTVHSHQSFFDQVKTF